MLDVPAPLLAPLAGCASYGICLDGISLADTLPTCSNGFYLDQAKLTDLNRTTREYAAAFHALHQLVAAGGRMRNSVLHSDFLRALSGDEALLQLLIDSDIVSPAEEGDSIEFTFRAVKWFVETNQLLDPEQVNVPPSAPSSSR